MITDFRFLIIVLIKAERAWAYAMDLRDSSGGQGMSLLGIRLNRSVFPVKLEFKTCFWQGRRYASKSKRRKVAGFGTRRWSEGNFADWVKRKCEGV